MGRCLYRRTQLCILFNHFVQLKYGCTISKQQANMSFKPVSAFRITSVPTTGLLKPANHAQPDS